ncbi:MAG TPA: phospho-N-acetylmuramoyl-pentapeptide-transferase [Phototrophicaceae bacterium]|nr:phospho-N-acetylmuramoyl-pentapeptide-transferase [Phototrophicaceae bacterium]
MDAGLPLSLTVGAVSFILGVIWGGPLVEILRRLRIGKNIRREIQDMQGKKAGTPTMGGILIVLPVIIITLALNVASILRPDANAFTGPSVLLPLFVMVSFGAIGAVDDWMGVRRSQGDERFGEGMTGRAKMLLQIVLAGAVALVFSLYSKDGGFQFANEVVLPLVGAVIPITPILFIPLMMICIIGMANAVNFTDGLDGLAGIISASAYAAYGVIAYLQGQIFLVQLCFIVVGACFAFLWFNAHPAQLFMGDVGSMALGGMLGTIAIMTGQWLLLPIIAIVPMAELISVILQVSYFKATKGQRLFKRTPIHHHFELSGWSETQIVQRFWLVGLLAAMVGVALALL